MHRDDEFTRVDHRASRFLLAALLTAASVPTYSATILYDTSIPSVNGANGIATIAGQGSTTIQTIAVVPGYGGVAGVSACQIAVAGCDAPGGSVTWNTYPTIPGAVVTVDAVAGTTSQLGANGLEASMRVTSSGGATVGAGNSSLNLSTRDQQQLRLSVTGANAPTYIPISMTYSMLATTHNASTGAQPLHVSSGISLVLAQASTFAPSQLGLYSAFAPFWASVNAEGNAGFDSSGGTVTLNLLANELYVLNQQSFQNVLLQSATNYAGLDLSLYAFADPTFAIDPSFLVPAGVSIDIQRVTNVTPVPLPAVPWLLLSGLVVLGVTRLGPARATAS